jgi:hypothetical protein
MININGSASREAEFSDEIQTKVLTLKSFPPCYSKSHLQLCHEMSISSNSRNLLQFLRCVTVSACTPVTEKGGKSYRKPHLLPRNLYRNSSLRTLKIMPRNCTFVNLAPVQKCGIISHPTQNPHS